MRPSIRPPSPPHRPHTGWVPLPRRPLPILSPHREMFDSLLRYPAAALRVHAVKRGLRAPPRASRRALAAALVRSMQVGRAEQAAAAGESTYDSRDDTYPTLVRALRERGATRVLDLGCGPGLFAEALRDGHPELQRYLGVEQVEGLVTQARRRFPGSPRFAFQQGDIRERLPSPRWRPDAVLLTFVISYLDTSSADQLLQAVSRAWPGAALVVAASFSTCADLRPGVPEADRSALARRALQGDAAAIAAWDTARLGAYLRALEDRYALEAEEMLPDGERLLWVARARSYAGTAQGSARQRRRPWRISGKRRRTAAASS